MSIFSLKPINQDVLFNHFKNLKSEIICDVCGSTGRNTNCGGAAVRDNNGDTSFVCETCLQAFTMSESKPNTEIAFIFAEEAGIALDSSNVVERFDQNTPFIKSVLWFKYRESLRIEEERMVRLNNQKLGQKLVKTYGAMRERFGLCSHCKKIIKCTWETKCHGCYRFNYCSVKCRNIHGRIHHPICVGNKSQIKKDVL